MTARNGLTVAHESWEMIRNGTSWLLSAAITKNSVNVQQIEYTKTNVIGI